MKNFSRIIFLLLGLVVTYNSYGQEKENDTLSIENKKPTYSFGNLTDGVLYLKNPTEKKIEYDPKIGRYIVREKIGNTSFTTPTYLTEEEYQDYRLKKDVQDYFKAKSLAVDGLRDDSEDVQKDLLPTFYVNNSFFNTIFGGSEIKMVPRGAITLRFGLLYQNVENPLLSEENRKSYTPEFDQQIRASLTAKVGERLTADINYDTQSTFSFQNQVKLAYEPTEDDIIRSIEVGNVSMDVKNNLISGSQSLFGVKTQLQFGATSVTGVFSQQQSQTKNVVAEGGAALSEFELRTTQYDNNKHFFLAQYFRNRYNDALKELPLINSAVQITKVEVWVTNRNTNTQDVRNIVGLVDLAESGVDKYDNSQSNITNTTQVTQSAGALLIPRNEENSLSQYVGTQNNQLREVQNVPSTLSGFSQGSEYAIVENARKLTSSEFTYHPQLGYISLNSRLNDGDVMAVSYEYTYNGQAYRVGELSTDGVESDQNIVVKLIRPQLIDTQTIVWNLMMKNIYSLGAYDMQTDGFRLDLLYRDDATGQATNNLLQAEEDIKNRTILNLTNLDRLDGNNNLTRQSGDAYKGDGFFDYVENLTVDSQNGSIIFPSIEPFGRDLEATLTNEADKDKYVFNELYTTTASVAENDYQDRDKFILSGQFKSSGTDGISLGAFNVPRGSVTVTSGGIELVEGVDYTVDYFAGIVKIINPSIESSGQAVNVSLENNTFFNQQTKTYVGVDVEHKFSDHFVLGATYLNISEQPISNKVQVGQDPINNSMYGLNFNYSTEVPVLTDLANYLPNIDTDAPSTISVRGDIAYLRPNTPSSIDIGGEATTYIDDFEGAQIPISIGTAQNWSLASTPVGFDGVDFGVGFDGESNYNNIDSGKKRAKLAWYTIDQLFYSNTSLRPSNVDPDELSRAEVRPVQSLELFPERNLDITQRTNLQTFDLTYYPNERGPYNYDTTTATDPKVLDTPEDRWAGITRGLTTTDFQNSNIQYIEFWVQDPYDNYSITNEDGVVVDSNPTNQNGSLYINLGSISEDVLKDGRKVFENGLPEDGDASIGIDETNVANVPTEKSLLYAFDTGDTTRSNQDVGLDGMSDEVEASRFPDLELEDPSSDNYQFYRGTDLDNTNASILRRYKNYNNTEGNSPTAALSQESYPTAATNNPDVEDADRDQTMNTLDAYWQYKIDLSQNSLSKETNPYISDERTTTVTLENGTDRQFKWYQFRVPIAEGTSINGINSFQSIRFMRMFLTDFEIPVALRFAELQLVRGDWRIYDNIIDENDNLTERELTDTNNLVETGVVNIEENENRIPINYILPPTITRENLQGTSSVLQQNEQSLSLTVNNLEQENTIGIYKNVNVDMRMFKTLKMFIHAEELAINTVNDDDLVAIIRLGSDTNDNYYQIEIPLKTTEVPNFGTSNALGEYTVWPEDNNLDVSLTDLTTLKLDRDDLGESSLSVYPTTVDNSVVQLRIKGNPNLSNVRTIFMGIKNTDVTQKSAEIWFNELRMSGFDNEGGWATNMSADATIADFAKIALNGGYQSIGFGSIDQSVNERSQEEIKNYSVNTSINAGQLLPNDWNVRIPVNYTVSEEIRTPKYDPQYEDVLSKDRENTNNIDIKSKRRSISLINVKKDRSDGSLKKPQVYDIENFSVSYSYSDAVNESYTIEKDISKKVNASANYAFKFKQIEVTPFKNIELFDNKNLKLIKDFNFNLLPSSIGVNSAIKRNYSEYKTRDLLGTTTVEGSIPIPTLKQRNFLFDWNYNIGYQLTSAINVSFEASNNYIYDTYEYDGTSEEVVDNMDLYSDFFNIGRPSNYAQSLSANYKIPINKIPLLSFVSADYTYSGNFNWEAASPSFVEQVGNTIQNGQTHNFTSSLNFSKLYSEIGLKKLFSPSTKKRKLPTVGRGKKSSSFSVGDFIYDLLSAVKTAKFSYNRNTGSTLNGYVPEIGFLGRNKYNGSYAPSLSYVFGQQTNILQNSVTNGWLVGRSGEADDVVYNKNYTTNIVTSANYDVTIKPINDLNIQFTGTRAYSNSSQQQVDYITGSNDIEASQINEYGSFNISHSLIKTAVNSNADELFNTFISNRAKIVSQIYPDYQVEIDEGTGTYSQALNSQEVLIHSFVSAYSGNDVVTSDKTIFKSMPIPNWQLTYRGLMRLGFIKSTFSNFTLTHGYNSSYTINNFSSNLNSDTTNPFQSNYIYSGVTLVDAFSPLIKIDVKLKNSLSFVGTVNSSRTLSLNLNNTTLSEVLGNEYVFGIGYRIKDVAFKTRFLKKRKTLKGDLNIKADVSYRTDVTSVRSIDSATSQPVGGQNLLGIKVAADYNLSRSFTASLYYDQNVSSYAISTLYPRQSVNAGLSIVYNLGN